MAISPRFATRTFRSITTVLLKQRPPVGVDCGVAPASQLLRHHLLFRLLGALVEEGAGDDLAVYLAGPLPYLVDLDLPPVAGDSTRLHKAFATPYLDSPIRGTLGGLGGEHLGHARLPPEGPSLNLKPRGLEYHVARQLNLHRHVRELELYGLELGDGTPELLPLFRPRQRLVKASLSEPHGECGDRDPATIERREELVKAFPALAEEVLFGDAAVLEVERMLVRGTPAQLLVGRAPGVALRILGDEDRGQLGSSVLAGASPGDDRNAAGDVGSGVRDPLLRPVDDPLAALELRRRPRTSSVRACLFLRKAERPEVLACGASGEEFFLLFSCTVGSDGSAAQGDVGLHGYPDRGICA